MAIPIWQNYFTTLGNNASYQFRIRLDNDSGAIIFSGKAYKKPGESSVYVRLNDICANYLNEELIPDFVHGQSSDLEYSRTFVVEKYTSSWVEAEIVEFANNWSYNSQWAEAQGLSFPVTKISTRQPILWSWTSMPSSVRCYYSRPNTVSWISKNISTTAGRKTLCIIPQAYMSNINGIRINVTGVAAREYEIVNSCARFALYYVNSYGGWDTALMDGNYTISTDVERYIRETESVGQKVNYLNLMERYITLNTGWLTDAQAEMMGELMNSTNVWLYDMDADWCHPIILTDNTWVQKSFKNQGGRLFNYTIQAQFAKREIRR